MALGGRTDIQWQVLRDFAGAAERPVERERSKIARGLGTSLPATAQRLRPSH